MFYLIAAEDGLGVVRGGADTLIMACCNSEVLISCTRVRTPLWVIPSDKPCLVSKSTIPIYFDYNSSKSDGNPIVIVFATILNSYT